MAAKAKSYQFIHLQFPSQIPHGVVLHPKSQFIFDQQKLWQHEAIAAGGSNSYILTEIGEVGLRQLRW